MEEKEYEVLPGGRKEVAAQVDQQVFSWKFLKKGVVKNRRMSGTGGYLYFVQYDGQSGQTLQLRDEFDIPLRV